MTDAEIDRVLAANLYLASFVMRVYWLWELETKWGVRPRKESPR